MSRLQKIAFALSVALLASPVTLPACSACYGVSDSAMARGMNWGIFSLLGVVLCVLSTFATFMVFLAKKSAAVSAEDAKNALSPNPTEKI